MVFPQTALEPTVELQLGGVWTEITQWVYVRDSITITRGRQDEQSSPEPSTCRFTVNNRDGRFSPRNPSGAYYGLIGRNTPVRVGVNLGATRLVVSDATEFSSTPDSAGLSITGDIDLRVDARFASWADGTSVLELAQKDAPAPQRGWQFDVDTDGRLAFTFSSDGTATSTAYSTVAVPNATGRQAVRVTLDVDNGAAGRTITFYTAATNAGPWTQLGDAVVQAGTTSIFNNNAITAVGFECDNGGEFYAAEIRNGIDGTIVGNPDWTAAVDGATSVTDSAGNLWTLTSGAEITNRRYRFHGEVSSFPVAWDLSGQDVYVPIEASGIRRRLGQGASPLQSAFRRAAIAVPSLQAYWPMEDEEGSTSLASATGASPLRFTSAVTVASDDTAFLCSAALPNLGGGQISGSIPAFASTGSVQVRFLAKVAAAAVGTRVLCKVRFVGGTVGSADVLISETGSLAIQLYNSDDTVALGATSFFSFEANGDSRQFSMELVQDGPDVDLKIASTLSGATPLEGTGTVAGQTLGVPTSIVFGPANPVGGATIADAVVGHLTVQSITNTLSDLAAVLDSYAGDPAGEWIERLCDEEGVTFAARGDLGDSTEMGPQVSATFLELVDQAASSDLGVALESRDEFALSYRPRSTFYNQHPALSLDYGDLSSLTPTDDDQLIRNDITVSRIGGSSARAVEESGPLSIQAPPDGVGRYDDSPSLSLFADAHLADQANWRLHLGTVDEARYPTLSFNLNSGSFPTDSDLTAAALDLDQGDLIEIADPPAWLPPDDIRQIAQGFVETIEPFSYGIEVNCTPASVWEVGVYDHGTPASRYATSGSTINEDLTTTETDVGVATTTGPVWTQAAGDLPFDIVIGGERMTVTAVTGSTSPQVFTVTRSVNGVVKTHLSGAIVELFQSARYAL